MTVLGLLLLLLGPLVASGAPEAARSSAAAALAEDDLCLAPLSGSASGNASACALSALQAQVHSRDRGGRIAVEPATLTEQAPSGQTCVADAECCDAATQSSSFRRCRSFCFLGQDIVDKQDLAGWHVQGMCKVKWPGFCREDEECQDDKICQRALGSLEGACVDDTLCRGVQCGSGHCTLGKCVCEWGYKGKNCERSENAYAFLFYGNSSVNLVTTRVLVRSLRTSGWKDDIVAMVPDGMDVDTPQHILDVLEGDGVKIVHTPATKMPDAMDADPIIHSRWSGVMNKINVWQLTNYSRVALVDTDIVWDVEAEDPGNIFEECQAQFCAVRDGDPQFINAGVMVVSPSRKRFNHIVEALGSERHHYLMPEQSFLTRYAEGAGNDFYLEEIPAKWNSCVSGGMLLNIGWADTGHNALHSCSWGAKPPNVRMCTMESGCDPMMERHTVLVFQWQHSQVDSCITNVDETACSAQAGCMWCSNYCSDVRVSCSDELFSSYVEDMPPDAEAVKQCLQHEEAAAKTVKDEELAFAEMPLGWWAWPQVAIYQVLVDRFAAPAGTTCTALDDYCGGTFAAMREKLPYLQELGVDGLLMSPVVENMPKGYHGYWPKDLNTVNPRLGTPSDLLELTVGAHTKGMKVISDVVLNHGGMPGMGFEEIGTLKPFNKPEHYHADNCTLWHEEDFHGRTRMERCQLFGMPDYKQENPAVRSGLQMWLRNHVDHFGFDAIRIDAARHMPRSFLHDIPHKGPPIPAFYEIPDNDLTMQTAYSKGDYDAVYNYPLYYALQKAFAPSGGAAKSPMTSLLPGLSGDASEGHLLLNFVDNNDLPRFLRLTRGDRSLYHSALVYVLGAVGTPVLVYGSEQDVRGPGNTSDPMQEEQAHLWRPPLWQEGGFQTSGSTFRLMKRLLWLRKRLNGMHQYKAEKVFADQEWLVYSRGPVFFAVSNIGRSGHARSQRVLWLGNHTAVCHPVRLCNMLVDVASSDCILTTPGQPLRMELFRGSPKVYVPIVLLEELDADEMVLERQSEMRYPMPQEKSAESSVVNNVSVHVPSATSASAAALLQDGALAGAAAAGGHQVGGRSMVLLGQKGWRQLPDIPREVLEMVPRHRRSVQSEGTALQDAPLARPTVAPFESLPALMDGWYPPVGSPTGYSAAVALTDACHYSRKEQSVILVHQGAATYALCADGPACDAARELGPKLPGNQFSVLSRPVVHATYGLHDATDPYELMIKVLPSFMQFVDRLMDESTQVFLGRAEAMVWPVLARLGIPVGSVLWVDKLPSEFGVSHFCSSKMYVQTTGTDELLPLYPHERRIGDLRRALAVSGGAPRRNKIVLLVSSGQRDQSKLEEAISNQFDLEIALRKLGRPVQVLKFNTTGIDHMIDVLAGAEVVVGLHGAHMSAMIYAPDGTRVVEVVPPVAPERANSGFWNLAGVLLFPYTAVSAATSAPDGEATAPGATQVEGTAAVSGPIEDAAAVAVTVAATAAATASDALTPVEARSVPSRLHLGGVRVNPATVAATVMRMLQSVEGDSWV